ncbi:MAG: aminotransferase class IV [Acidobacteriota bacterium]
MAIRANINGRMCTEAEAVVSVFDHGFLYGEGVYETLRTYRRKPFLFDRHLRRLRASASMIDLDVPLTGDCLLARMEETAADLNAEGEIYFRILLTRGPGDFCYDLNACPEPTLVIIARPFAPPPEEVYARGIRVSVVSTTRSYPNSINPLIKSNNLLPNALAMREARKRGAYEGVMVNFRGEITECSQSNFFVVEQGQVLTPPLESGLLAGITRELVLEISAEAQLSTRECVLRVRDLLDADEAFLTSTTREVVPIVRVDGHVIGSGQPGPITRMLLDRFRTKALELSS